MSTLIGFEAAARLSSFASAADELHLSHSAVSHQIKQLESELGQALFRRVGRSVVLTDAGQDFARTVRDTLHRLEHGVARLAPYQKPSGVIVYTSNAFARGFILPRMARLRHELAGIDLWLDTSGRKVDFDIDEVDILITADDGVASSGVVSADLTQDQRTAVAAPSLIERMATLPVHEWPLLHDESQITWREWLTLSGQSTARAIEGANFSDHAVMLDAAVAGHGAALGSLVCAEAHLRSKALVILQGPRFSQPTYRIYCDARSFADQRTRRVYEWFIGESVPLLYGFDAGVRERPTIRYPASSFINLGS